MLIRRVNLKVKVVYLAINLCNYKKFTSELSKLKSLFTKMKIKVPEEEERKVNDAYNRIKSAKYLNIEVLSNIRELKEDYTKSPVLVFKNVGDGKEDRAFNKIGV